MNCLNGREYSGTAYPGDGEGMRQGKRQQWRKEKGEREVPFSFSFLPSPPSGHVVVPGVRVTVYVPQAVNTIDTLVTTPFRVTTRSTWPAVKRGATWQVGS